MPPRHHVVFRSLFWAVTGLIGLALLAIGITAFSLRSDQTAAGVRETERFANILAGQTARSVAAIDAVLTEVQLRAAGLNIETPADFRLAYSQDMFRFLIARLAQLPQATAITLTGSDGNLVNTTRRWPRPEGNFADRDFFQHLRAVDDAELYVSLAVTSRLAGSPTIYFAKRINTAKGEFAGVAAVGVEITHFRDIYEAIGSVEGQSFLLMRRDGMVLWRYPDPGEKIGQVVPAGSRSCRRRP